MHRWVSYCFTSYALHEQFSKHTYAFRVSTLPLGDSASVRCLTWQIFLLYIGASRSLLYESLSIHDPSFRRLTEIFPDLLSHTDSAPTIVAHPSAQQKRRVIHRPPTQGIGQLRSNDLEIPVKVIACLERGWAEHIPLTSLTNEACRTLSLARSTNDTEFAFVGQGRFLAKGNSFDCSKEDQIDIYDWREATERLVQAIEKHLYATEDADPGGPDAELVARRWRLHFHNICTQGDFRLNWPMWRAYDIEVRRRYIHSSGRFDPGEI